MAYHSRETFETDITELFVHQLMTKKLKTCHPQSTWKSRKAFSQQIQKEQFLGYSMDSRAIQQEGMKRQSERPQLQSNVRDGYCSYNVFFLNLCENRITLMCSSRFLFSHEKSTIAHQRDSIRKKPQKNKVINIHFVKGLRLFLQEKLREPSISNPFHNEEGSSLLPPWVGSRLYFDAQGSGDCCPLRYEMDSKLMALSTFLARTVANLGIGRVDIDRVTIDRFAYPVERQRNNEFQSVQQQLSSAFASTMTVASRDQNQLQSW